MTGFYVIFLNGEVVAECETIEVEHTTTPIFQRMKHGDALTIFCELPE